MTPPAASPTVRVIVVSHNSAASLPACLQALQPQLTELGGELVVVDNDSEDDSVAVARRHGATVIEAARNLGFGAGCNLGAQGAAAELLVMVNPDSRLDAGCLSQLLEVHRAHVGAGPIGGRARLSDRSYDARAVLGRPRLRGALFFGLGLDVLFRGSRWIDPEHGPRAMPEGEGGAVAVEAVSGAVLAVPRDLWSRLHGFDERYYLYGEDVDLCLRAASIGWQPMMAVGASYTHVGGLTADGSHHRRMLLHRGKVELYRRHLAPWQAALAVRALQVGALLRGAATVADGTGLARRAAPWMELYRARRSWRDGHRVMSAGAGR